VQCRLLSHDSPPAVDPRKRGMYACTVSVYLISLASHLYFRSRSARAGFYGPETLKLDHEIQTHRGIAVGKYVAVVSRQRGYGDDSEGIWMISDQITSKAGLRLEQSLQSRSLQPSGPCTRRDATSSPSSRPFCCQISRRPPGDSPTSQLSAPRGSSWLMQQPCRQNPQLNVVISCACMC